MDELNSDEIANSRTDSSQTQDLQILDGKFEILCELGRGSWGIVYKARNLVLDNLLALKIIDKTRLDNPDDIKRFNREAAVLARLAHPQIVKFVAYGVLSDGRHYMALEFVEGESLADILKREGALRQERALALFIDIAEALKCAHANSVVHRDLKPGNVMISRSDGREQAKLIDFGIMKARDDGAQSLTKTAMMLGSPNYMSPEQCRSEPAEFRSDIYSFACLMYEALVGSAPMHDDSDLAVMANHLNRVISSVPARFGISPGLEKCILKCLSKNQDERVQSAALLCDLLRAEVNVRPRKVIKISRKQALLVALLLSIVGIGAYKLREARVSTLQEAEQQMQNQSVGPYPVSTGDLFADLEMYESYLARGLQSRSANLGVLVQAAKQVVNRRSQLGILSLPESLGVLEARLIKEIDREGVRMHSKQSLFYVDLLCCLACVQSMARKYEEADLSIEKIKSLSKPVMRETIQTRLNDLASVAAERGEYKRAISYNKFCLDFSDSGERYNHMIFESKLLRWLGEPEKQRLELSAAYDYGMKLVANGDSPQEGDIVYLCDELMKIGMHEKAASLLQAYCKGRTPLIDLLFCRARCLLVAGDFAEAEAEFRRIQKPIVGPELLEPGQAEQIQLRLLLAMKAQGKKLEHEICTHLDELKARSATEEGDKQYRDALFQILNFWNILGLNSDELFARILSEAMAHEKSHPDWSGRMRYYAAAILSGKGKCNDAVDHLLQAEKLLEAQNDYASFSTLMSTFQNEMLLYSLSRDYESVELVYVRAKKKFGRVPSSDFMLRSTYAAAISQKDILTAIQVAEANLNAYRNLSVKAVANYHECALQLARFYEKRHRFDNARATLESSIKKLQEYRADYPADIAAEYRELANVFQQGKNSSGVAVCRKLCESYERKAALMTVPFI